jgi:hypothetical protein
VPPEAPAVPPAPPIETPSHLNADAWFAFKKMVKICGGQPTPPRRAAGDESRATSFPAHSKSSNRGNFSRKTGVREKVGEIRLVVSTDTAGGFVRGVKTVCNSLERNL